ncbi:hypothetical protein [Streptomyces qinglanensis]|uniref:hypothetical protein n=1 Tax=Streptomyces qinglanensis TaxID=943816 RepID=UPI003D74E92E
MTEHEGTPHEDAAPPVPRIDPAMFTAGGPGKTVIAASEEFTGQLRARVEAEGGVLLPGGTREEADMARASLAALKGWAARRDRLPEQRADLLAAAWWSGWRNVAELARTADVSRDTVYDDLRARGIDPKDKAVTGRPLPRFVPLRAEAMRGLTDLADATVGPAMLTVAPDQLALTAWAITGALGRITELLDEPESRPWHRDVLAQDLTARLQTALGHAHALAATGQTDEQLASHTHNHLLDVIEDETVAGTAALTLVLPPDGDQVTVNIGHADGRGDRPRGWTVLRSDSPLLDPELDGAEHLAIQAALATLAETLGRHLLSDEDKDQESVPPIQICGVLYPANNSRYCTLPLGHQHTVHQMATGAQWPV